MYFVSVGMRWFHYAMKDFGKSIGVSLVVRQWKEHGCERKENTISCGEEVSNDNNQHIRDTFNDRYGSYRSSNSYYKYSDSSSTDSKGYSCQGERKPIPIRQKPELREVHMEAERIMAYELPTGRISIYISNGEYVVVNTLTNKALHCLNLEQAMDIFDRCVDTVKDSVLN
jgi:hypothetical protein